MLQSGVNIMQSAAADLSFYDKSISAAKVILTGFTVVFAMLFFLIIIIKVYSATIAGAQRAGHLDLPCPHRQQRPRGLVAADGGAGKAGGHGKGFCGLRQHSRFGLRVGEPAEPGSGYGKAAAAKLPGHHLPGHGGSLHPCP